MGMRLWKSKYFFMKIIVSSCALGLFSKVYSSSKSPLLKIDESYLREDLFKTRLLDCLYVDLSLVTLLIAFSKGNLRGEEVYLYSILEGVRLFRFGRGMLGFCFCLGVICCCKFRCKDVEVF